MEKLKKAWDLLVEKTIYEKDSITMCKKEIDENNALILQTMLFAVSIILVINGVQNFTSFALINEGVVTLSGIYFLALIIALLIFFYIKFISIKYIVQITYLVYILAFIYSFMISISVPNNVTVTFLLVLFMVSVLFIDYGWRIHMFMTLAVVFYINAIEPFKEAYSYKSELENAYTVLFLLFIIGTISRNSTIEAFRRKSMLRRYAYIDQLTGVNNRRKLFEDFTEIQNDPAKNSVTAIALLDIDNFKLYNDVYGHGAGDAALRAVGKCFNMAEESGHLTCYRYGGEEFAIIYKDLLQEEIIQYTDDLMNSIRDLKIEHSQSSHNILTVSIGIAIMPKNTEPKFEKALSVADKALYEAKDGGRNKKEISLDYMQIKEESFSKMRKRDA